MENNNIIRNRGENNGINLLFSKETEEELMGYTIEELYGSTYYRSNKPLIQKLLKKYHQHMDLGLNHFEFFYLLSENVKSNPNYLLKEKKIIEPKVNEPKVKVLKVPKIKIKKEKIKKVKTCRAILHPNSIFDCESHSEYRRFSISISKLKKKLAKQVKDFMLKNFTPDIKTSVYSSSNRHTLRKCCVVYDFVLNTFLQFGDATKAASCLGIDKKTLKKLIRHNHVINSRFLVFIIKFK